MTDRSDAQRINDLESAFVCELCGKGGCSGECQDRHKKSKA